MQKPANVLLSPAVRILYVAMALAGLVIRSLGGGLAEEVNKFPLITASGGNYSRHFSPPETGQAYRVDQSIEVKVPIILGPAGDQAEITHRERHASRNRVRRGFL